MRKFPSVIAVLVAFILAASPLGAQPIGVPVQVWMSCTLIDAGGECQVSGSALHLYPGSTDGDLYLDVLPGQKGNFNSPLQVVRLEPGKVYTFTIDGNYVTNAGLNVTAPPGYDVLLDNVPRTTEPAKLSGGAAASQSFKVQIIASADDLVGAAGLCSALADNKIHWMVSLGYLKNGTTAGSLLLSDAANGTDWSAFFTPAALSCLSASPEIVTYNNPAKAANLRQIMTNQALVDVVDSSIDSSLSATQYEIRFYDPAAYSGSAFPYAITGTAFRKYRVEQGATATSLKLTSYAYNSSGTLKRSAHTTVQRSGFAPNFTWTVVDWTDDTATGNPPVTRVVTSAGTPAAGPTASRTETLKISGADEVSVFQSKAGLSLASWGEVVTALTNGSNNPEQYGSAYYDGTASTHNLGFITTTLLPGGQWEAYDYASIKPSPGSPQPDYGNGKPLHIYRPFNGAPAAATTTPADAAAGEVTTLGYTNDAFGVPRRLSTIQRAIKGVTVTNSSITYSSAVAAGYSNTLHLLTATRQDHNYNSPAAHDEVLTTVSKSFSEDAGSYSDATNPVKPAEAFYRYLPYSQVAPDGTMTDYSYSFGTFNSSAGDNPAFTPGLGMTGPCTCIAVITGTSLTSVGVPIALCNNAAIDPIQVIEGKSTMVCTIRDAQALIRRVENYVWSKGSAQSADWRLISHVDYTYDRAGHLVDRLASNGAHYKASYDKYAELVDAETNEAGITQSYVYDAAGRTSTITKANGPVTTLGYDAAGHMTSRAVSGGGETIQDTSQFDDAGRTATQTPAGQKSSVFSYNYSASGWSQTVTAPDTGTTTTAYQIDGRMLSVTGSATVARYFSYDVTANGLLATKVNLGSSNSPRVQQTWLDWLGRTDHASRAGFSKGQSPEPDFIEQNVYELSTGHLVKTTRTGYAPTLYAYDELGSVNRTGLSINGGSSLAVASDDRITDVNQSISYLNSAWWLRKEILIYPYASTDSANNAKPKTAQLSLTRLSGFSGTTQAEVKTTDAEGNNADAVTSVDWPNATVTVSTTMDGYPNPITAKTVNGLTTATSGYDGLTINTVYDALERPWKHIDSRNNNTTVTTYLTGTGFIYTVTDAAGNAISTNTYDDNGRVKTTQNASTKYTRYSYNTLGQITHQWGSANWPVSYQYDPNYGERTAISTYRKATSTDAATWDAVAPGTADTTTFSFDPASGLLWQKTDAATHKVSYDYNSSGLVSSRTNARSIKTTYAYDSNTGELTSATYDDGSTPTRSFAYTRLGQISTATDGTGQRSFHYDPANPWRLDNEALPAFYNSRFLSRHYDASTQSSAGAFGGVASATFKGRPSGFQIGATADSADDLAQTQGFNPLGRYLGVTSQIGALPALARNFVYTYRDSSALVDHYATGVNFAVYRDYEAKRDLATQVKAVWADASTTKIISEFDYAYDEMARRKNVLVGGAAYTDYWQGMPYAHVYQTFSYNDHGELQTAALYRGDAVPLAPTTGDEIPGHHYEYRYDSVGNRLSSGKTGVAKKDGGSDDGYLPNVLNQYDSRDNLNLRIFGTSSPQAAISVSGAGNTVRLDRCWSADLTPANSQGPVQGSAGVFAVLPNTGGADVIRADSKSFSMPAASQTFTHDEDGNLTADGVWQYTYDAENQLIRLKSLLPSTGNFKRLQLDFTYDYLGRRVQKTVTDLATGSTSTRRFIYDGWNLVAEYALSPSLTTFTLKRTYTWGLDQAGSLTATGGVGALLQIVDHASGSAYLPTYDGNGNLAALVNAASGAIAAAYEYDPFGNLIRADSPDAAIADQPFRFSTKYTDAESGLVYYGYRYYSPANGRFINRDSIGELGGVNLYGFGGNDAINRSDFLGKWFSISPFPVHQNSIGRVLGWLPSDKVSNLQFAQTVVDSSFYQSLQMSFVHAMTDARDSGGSNFSRLEANLFVGGAIDRAVEAYKSGNQTDGDLYLGAAIHTLQDATSPAHADFATWYGEGSLFHLIAHVAHEAFDPGPGSALDKATLYAYSLALLASQGKQLPSDVFVYTDKLTNSAPTQSGARYASYAPTEAKKNKAKKYVNVALDNILVQYNKLQADLISGEYARRSSFYALLNLQDMYVGSDEWLDSHLHPSHFYLSALLQNYLYNLAMIGTTKLKPGEIDPNAAWAESSLAMYNMAVTEQNNIEQNIAQQAGKSK